MVAQVTPLPTPPNRSMDSSTFTSTADSFLGALPTFGTEINAVASEVSANAVSADVDANTATAQALIAANAAEAALSSAGVTLWVSGNTYAQGVTVISPANSLAFRKKTPSSSSTTDPNNDPVNWLPIGGSPVGTLYANNNFGGF